MAAYGLNEHCITTVANRAQYPVPMAYSTKGVYSDLAKPPMKFNGSIPKPGLTSLVR